jgi:sigma-70-like protein
MDLSETMRDAVILAEAKGYVTFEELNQIVPPTFGPEDIESLLSALSDAGIWIQEN